MAYDFTTDPFTQVYESIWAILEYNATFTSLVKPGNRIKYLGNIENPEKFEAQFADLNEVELYPLDKTDFISSSSHVRFIKLWEMRITSPSTRLDTYIHPLAWKIMEILREAADHLFGTKATEAGISYDMGYVKGFRLLNYSPANDDEELQRDSERWTARLQIQVIMSIHREQLVV